MCNNCKCPRESHDVYHEEFVDVRDRIGFKSNECGCKERTLQEGYSWVPPGLASDKVYKTVKLLSTNKSIV